MVRTETFKTDSANYTVYISQTDSKKPFTIFLHGGPGFNCHGERHILGPGFDSQLNFLWFDHLGCAESPAHSSDRLKWSNQINDIAAIVQRFASAPVQVIGHCLGAQLTHDLVRQHRGLVKSVVWYSPVNSVADVFKGVLKRSLEEGRLLLSELDTKQRTGIEKFFVTPERDFGESEVILLLTLAGQMRGFQELYWHNLESMNQYLKWMSERPFNPEVFVHLMIDYFKRGPLTIPSYEGIPVFMLRSNNDKITPWASHGQVVLKSIPHAKVHILDDGFHWLQFEKTAECIKHTIDFFSQTTSPLK